MLPTTQQFYASFTRFEEKVNHFYLDSKGYLTIAIGSQVFNPAMLKMYRRNTSPLELATADAVFQESRRIQIMAPNRLATYYEPHCDLFMRDEEIMELFNLNLNNVLEQLTIKLPKYGAKKAFADYPAEAILAITDMAYNLGTAKLFFKFPLFCNGFINQDFALCAAECQRESPISKERNEWTAQQFKLAVQR
jgi:hypothetical protein